MYTTIDIGPQKYTVPREREAEVRRLLWSQLRVAKPANDGGSKMTHVVARGLTRGRERNRVRLRLVVNQFDIGQNMSEPVGPDRPGQVRPTG